jgi:hypothetical protein
MPYAYPANTGFFCVTMVNYIATTSVDAGQTIPSLITNQIPKETTKGG